MDSNNVDLLAKIIWDYLHLNYKLKKVDCIFALGSIDVRIAQYSAKLFLEGYAPVIIFSGGLGRISKDIFKKSEAEMFADIAIQAGVPQEKIIVENKSSNTGENIAFTKQLLSDRGLNFKTFILVQKPYMERRTYAAFKKLWPEKRFIVTSPPISYEDYPNINISKDEFINIMVGDIQRIKFYPEKGFQIYQEIPDNVWRAYEKLVELGYTDHLIKN